jgi:predicted transcriptional regulator of viral defense system
MVNLNLTLFSFTQQEERTIFVAKPEQNKIKASRVLLFANYLINSGRSPLEQKFPSNLRKLCLVFWNNR